MNIHAARPDGTANDEGALLPVLVSVFVEQPCWYICKRKAFINLDCFNLFNQTHVFSVSLGNASRIFCFLTIKFSPLQFLQSLCLKAAEDRHWGVHRKLPYAYTGTDVYGMGFSSSNVVTVHFFNTAKHYCFEDNVWLKLYTHPHG